MSEIRMLINAKIKYFREKAGTSQEDLSIAINRSEDFIEKVEGNQYKELPTLVDVVLIEKQLKISDNDLLWCPEIRKIVAEKNIERTIK